MNVNLRRRSLHASECLSCFPLSRYGRGGARHSLEWVARAQALGWDVLLDAAAFVPTSLLDLSQVHPDFVPISFYKIFGYPTSVGALIARKEALRKFRRPWFAGGTINWGMSSA